jgi:hypothetical protein
MNPRKPKVLVVDDKKSNQLALEAVLGADYQLVCADSGEEALAMLTSQKDVDLILMDVQMPGMDGFETATEVKRIEGFKDVPIIFVTAIYTEDPYIRRGYEVGGIDYFSKPFDPEILRLKVAVYASFRLKAAVLRERERQIHDSEELLRIGRKLACVLDTLPLGVLIADTEGRICQTNDEVARILNTADLSEADSYGELLGWWDTAGKALRDREGPLARALRGESAHSERLQVRRFNGSLKSILASASPLRGLDGHLVGAVVLIQDRTETQEIERHLAQRVTQLVNLGVELEETTAG